MDLSIILWILGVLLVLAGLAGVVLPVFPGAILVLAGLIVAAWAGEFEKVGPWAILILAVLTALSYIVDMLATMFGVKRFGASTRALAGASIGFLAGMFTGLPGMIIGPFIGAAIGEYTVRNTAVGRERLEAAGRAGLGAWLGMVAGVAARLTLVFSMIGIFVVAYLV